MPDCPYEGCSYTSHSEFGIKQHHKRTHGISLTLSTFNCDYCGAEFERQESKVERWDGTFCSSDCRAKDTGEKLSEVRSGSDNPNWQGKNSTDVVESVCNTCGEKFEQTRYQQQRTEHSFCSRDCYYTDLEGSISGEENPRWRGGYEPYYGDGWLEARRETLERDSHECQDCGMTRDEHYDEYGADLEVHHKTPLRTFDDTADANKLSNLLTLCTRCHVDREHS